jgi:hypothetical protein
MCTHLIHVAPVKPEVVDNLYHSVPHHSVPVRRGCVRACGRGQGITAEASFVSRQRERSQVKMEGKGVAPAQKNMYIVAVLQEHSQCVCVCGGL